MVKKKISNETREKMRQARLGKKWSEEMKEKFRKAHKGKVLSEKHKQKTSKTMKERGIKPCELAKKVWKEKYPKGTSYGKHFSKESNIKKGARGSEHPNWKGGRIKGIHGYIHIKNREHPYRDSGGYVTEHRIIMENKLGRYLTPEEVVHHINGIKEDNRDENLQLFDNTSLHTQFHWDEDGKTFEKVN